MILLVKLKRTVYVYTCSGSQIRFSYVLINCHYLHTSASLFLPTYLHTSNQVHRQPAVCFPFSKAPPEHHNMPTYTTAGLFGDLDDSPSFLPKDMYLFLASSNIDPRATSISRSSRAEFKNQNCFFLAAYPMLSGLFAVACEKQNFSRDISHLDDRLVPLYFQLMPASLGLDSVITDTSRHGHPRGLCQLCTSISALRRLSLPSFRTYLRLHAGTTVGLFDGLNNSPLVSAGGTDPLTQAHRITQARSQYAGNKRYHGKHSQFPSPIYQIPPRGLFDF